MAVLPLQARNAGMFCLFVSIGMTLGVFMIMYTLSSESAKRITYTTNKGQPGKSRQNSASVNLEAFHHHLKITRSDYVARKELLDYKCQHMSQMKNNGTSSSTLPTTSYDQFIVDDEYKLIYCWVPKVASSNWKRVLTNLRQDYTNKQWMPRNRHKNYGLPSLASYSHSERTARLETYFKFLFVRHPLERLLSAYRNRFESRLHSKSRTDGFSSFSKFIQFLEEGRTYAQMFNIHWRPMVDLCFPCQVSYDFIGHYETLQGDIDYLFNLFHFKNVNFPTSSSYETKSSKPDVLHKYYANLTTHEMNILYTIYAKDFDSFAYERNY